jgi:hypothetical protein
MTGVNTIKTAYAVPYMQVIKTEGRIGQVCIHHKAAMTVE